MAGAPEFVWRLESAALTWGDRSGCASMGSDAGRSMSTGNSPDYAGGSQSTIFNGTMSAQF